MTAVIAQHCAVETDTQQRYRQRADKRQTHVTHLHMTLQRTCVTSCNCHLHSQWARLAPYKSCVSLSCIVRTCVDRDSTIWFFILFYISHWKRSRDLRRVDRSTQQGELKSSAMSGGTDRREDEHVPQFYGRIDEKFAEWETDAFKVEDRDIPGPRLYRRG